MASSLSHALHAPSFCADPVASRRAARRDPGFIDLGNEPALDPSSPTLPHLGRQGWSARWLGGSLLTGLIGAGLLGAAIFVSSEGEVTFAELAEPAPAGGLRNAVTAGTAARKADKLVQAEPVALTKQVLRSPMTLRAGDREVIKLRTFTRIATGLSMTSGVYATDIPPFNPLRFFADVPADRAIEPPPETSDAEVSVVKTDLATASAEPAAVALSDDDVLAQVEAEASLRSEGSRRNALPLPQAMMLSRRAAPAPVLGTGPGFKPDDAAFQSIEVRVVPENVSQIEKNAAGSADLSFSERIVPVRRLDTLESLLAANGADPEETRAIVGAIGRDRAIVEGMQVRLLLAPSPRPGAPRPVARASLVSERGIEAIAAVTDRGGFLSVAPPVAAARPEPKKPSDDDEDDEDEGSGATLYASLYETALKQDLPRPVIEELVRIFGYDVDFQRRVTPGDSFELFYATDDEASDRIEILSAALTIGSDVHRVYRFQDDGGAVDFLDGAGRSLKKFLIRKPVVEARLSSGFGSRFHPILGYSKLHSGVDWAARIGTPILAAGNGTVIKAGWDSGYGRRIEVQHPNGYVTTYNHQSGFARGIAPGSKVRQGQIIGYVGSTGLSTGAHLHFEVVVNGHFVDPMKIRVPRGRELEGRLLAEFTRQREQVDGLMTKIASPNRLAQGGR